MANNEESDDWHDLSSDSEDPIDAVIQMFGSSELVAAYDDPDHMQQLIQAGHPVTANAICAACYSSNTQALAILLSYRTDPDANPGTTNSYGTGSQPARDSIDWTPIFEDARLDDRRHWYPIQHAAGRELCLRGNREGEHAMMELLLQYKPNLYDSFRQAMWQPYPFPFPYAEESTYAPPRPRRKPSPSYLSRVRIICGSRYEEPEPEFGYGLRTVLHTMFEDGVYVKPILTDPNIRLDADHRDARGRTLLHAICRSAVGADARIGAAIGDLRANDYSGPTAANKALIAPADTESSLFHTIRNLGADVNAVDYDGKTILHHLLEARTTTGMYSGRPPLIYNTFRYVLKHHSDLVNQQDLHGTYPLHSALQRLRGHNEMTTFTDESPLEQVVLDLLDAGANPLARDGRGNTALHYLADNGLSERFLSEGPRALLHRFCGSALDVNARNARGHTALEILMDDNGDRDMLRSSNSADYGLLGRPAPFLDDVDSEVLCAFDQRGAHWSEPNTHTAQTLLHVVARHKTKKTRFRIKYLLAKGVDPNQQDENVLTALSVAHISSNIIAADILRPLTRSLSV